MGNSTVMLVILHSPVPTLEQVSVLPNTHNNNCSVLYKYVLSRTEL